MMDTATIFNLCFLLGMVIQIGLALRTQHSTEGGKAKMPLPSEFVISKKRAYWLLGTMALLMASSVWVYFVPHEHFKILPSDQLTPVTGKHFVNESVVLDGKDFEGCTFSGVTLVSEGKHNFTLFHNQFFGPLRLSWTSPVGKSASGEIIALLQQANMITNGNIVFVSNDDIVILKNEPTK
jgi:hypothetical protein